MNCVQTDVSAIFLRIISLFAVKVVSAGVIYERILFIVKWVAYLK